MGIKNEDFFADEYVQRPGDPNTAAQTPEIQSALKTVKGILAELELRIIEFFSEWPDTYSKPDHLSFMLVKK